MRHSLCNAACDPEAAGAVAPECGAAAYARCWSLTMQPYLIVAAWLFHAAVQMQWYSSPKAL